MSEINCEFCKKSFATKPSVNRHLKTCKTKKANLEKELAISNEKLKEMEKNPPYDVYGVFTVQEEVGIRGANVAAHQINPDFGIGLDTTIAYDLPGAQPHEMVTKLGEGTAIKIMDAMTICDYRMVDFMKQTSEKHKIKWQNEVLVAGGTDTAGIQRMGKDGAISGAISIPTRHLHQGIFQYHLLLHQFSNNM